MADEYYKEIAALVESGEYFDDARSWYQMRYLHYIVDRSYFMLLCLYVVLLIIFALSIFNSSKPLKPYKVVPIQITDQSTQYPVLISLGNRADSQESPHPPIQRYFLGKFVEAYQSYDFRQDFALLKRNEKLLSHFSSDKVLSDYKSFYSSANPSSPVLLLRNTAIQNVQIDPSSWQLTTLAEATRDIAGKFTATVDFTTNTLTSSTRTENKWRARITFMYKEVTYDKKQQDFTPLDLKVIGYETEKLQ